MTNIFGSAKAVAMAQTVLIAISLLALVAPRGLAVTNAPFSIEEREGVSSLVKPNGERFFSLGVCVVNEGATREHFNATNLGYGACQHCENANRGAEAT